MIKTDQHVTAEIKLYYDLFVPEDTSTKAPLLISAHGYAAHKRYMMREARLIAPQDFVVASLQAPNKFWWKANNGKYKSVFGWLTDYKPKESITLHHQFILDVIEKLAEEEIVDRSRVFLHGFSQSCSLNFRFAFTYPKTLKGIIGVCGGIPSDLSEDKIYQPTNADALYMYGNADAFYSVEKFKDFERRLNDYLKNFEVKTYNAGHEITDDMRKDIKKWLETKR